MSTEIKEYGKDDGQAFAEDLIQSVERKGESAGGIKYIFAMTTEEIVFSKAEMQTLDIPKLYADGLEIRIFDMLSEEKWFRTGIDKAFRYRRITDRTAKTEKNNVCQWDESQYLDIDDKKTKHARNNGLIEAGYVYATGGGKYPLPEENYQDLKIKIRNYLGEDTDTGELYVKDWRLAGFGEWEE